MWSGTPSSIGLIVKAGHLVLIMNEYVTTFPIEWICHHPFVFISHRHPATPCSNCSHDHVPWLHYHYCLCTLQYQHMNLERESNGLFQIMLWEKEETLVILFIHLLLLLLKVPVLFLQIQRNNLRRISLIYLIWNLILNLIFLHIMVKLTHKI